MHRLRNRFVKTFLPAFLGVFAAQQALATQCRGLVVAAVGAGLSAALAEGRKVAARRE